MSYSVHIRCPFRPSLFIHLALTAYEADDMVFPLFNQLTTSFHSNIVHGGCNCRPPRDTECPAGWLLYFVSWLLGSAVHLIGRLLCPSASYSVDQTWAKVEPSGPSLHTCLQNVHQ